MGDLIQEVVLADDTCESGEDRSLNALQHSARGNQSSLEKMAYHPNSPLVGAHSCEMDTYGSCLLWSCKPDRGPTHCNRGKCFCNVDYCSQNGVCVKRGTCNTNTGDSCRMFACASGRGETTC